MKSPWRRSIRTCGEWLERAFASKDVWKLAEKLVPKNGERAWRFNQALKWSSARSFA